MRRSLNKRRLCSFFVVIFFPVLFSFPRSFSSGLSFPPNLDVLSVHSAIQFVFFWEISPVSLKRRSGRFQHREIHRFLFTSVYVYLPPPPPRQRVLKRDGEFPVRRFTLSRDIVMIWGSPFLQNFVFQPFSLLLARACSVFPRQSF